MLKRIGERGHPCLLPDLSGKYLTVSLLSMIYLDILEIFKNQDGEVSQFQFTERFYHE